MATSSGAGPAAGCSDSADRKSNSSLKSAMASGFCFSVRHRSTFDLLLVSEDAHHQQTILRALKAMQPSSQPRGLCKLGHSVIESPNRERVARVHRIKLLLQVLHHKSGCSQQQHSTRRCALQRASSPRRRANACQALDHMLSAAVGGRTCRS